MTKRSAITAETISRVAAENAGHPVDKERAAAYAAALEPVLQLIDAVRSLPLKDIEPATVFRPQRHDDR